VAGRAGFAARRDSCGGVACLRESTAPRKKVESRPGKRVAPRFLKLVLAFFCFHWR
jgi:hypothetical protein